MSKEGNVTPYEMEKEEGCDQIWLVESAVMCQGQNLQALGLVQEGRQERWSSLGGKLI